MLLQKEINNGSIEINKYQDGEITVSNTVYKESILLTPQSLHLFQKAKSFSQLNIDDLIKILPSELEIVIIGCGKKQQFLTPKITQHFHNKGIAIEVMATRQACHTFKVLSYEQRKVVALLFPK